MATVKDHRDKQKYIDAAHVAEQKYGIPRNLLVGLLGAESNFNPNAVSSANAKGIAQFMKATAQEYEIDPLDPFQSIDAAGKYLSSSYKKFGNWDDSLRSYNLGIGGVQAWKAGKRSLPKETAEYTGRVYKHAGKNYSTEEINYTNSVAPYMNQTTTINQLEIPTISGNFAGVSDAQETEKETEEDKQPIKEAAEVKQQTNEYNFLKNYQEQYAQQQNEQPIQIPTIDVEQTVNDVSQFVNNPVAQQGRRPFKLQDERTLVQRDATSTQRPNTTIDQKQLAFIAQYAKKNNIPLKEASERLYNENQHSQNNQVRPHTPQTIKSRVWEVATHPMTAAGYVARNEDLPENFSRGEINPHEQALNIVNPFFYADQARQAIKNTSEGNFTEAGMNTLNILPLISEYGAMSKLFRKSSQVAPTIELEKAQNFVGKYNTNSKLLNPENISIENPKYNQFSNKVLNTKNQNLSNIGEPYISKRVFNDTREQQVFESSFQPEQQRILLERRTKYYDSNGNTISAPDNAYTPYTEDEYIKTFNTKRNRLQQGVIKDQEGQRHHPNQVTEIQGNSMATDGYGDITLLTVPDKGAPKIVMPNTGDHIFKGATKFTEYPITKEEQLFLEEYLNKK